MTIYKLPDSFRAERNARGERVLHHRTQGMIGLKFFAIVWCTFWLGGSSFPFWIQAGKSESVADFLQYAIKNWPLLIFVAIGLAVTVFFAWLLLKRTMITFGNTALSVDRSLLGIRTRQQLPKSTIREALLKKDGGEDEDSFPSWAVTLRVKDEGDQKDKSITLLSRQENEIAAWLTDEINGWLGKRRLHDATVMSHSSFAAAVSSPSAESVDLKDALRGRRWLRNFSLMVGVIWFGFVAFMFHEPVLAVLKSSSFRTSQYKALPTHRFEGNFGSVDFSLDTSSDTSWRYTTKARGTVALIDGELIFEIAELALRDVLQCRQGCAKIERVTIELSRETSQSFTTAAESSAILRNVDLPASGLTVRNIRVAMRPAYGAISLEELPLLWPVVRVEERGPAWSYLTPKPEVWRSILTRANGEDFWQNACDRTQSVWQLINMDCNDKLKSILTRAEHVNSVIDKGMGSDITPLNHALRMGNIEAATYMLSIGGDPTQDSPSGFNPIFGAAEQGRIDVVNLLLAHGVHPDAGGANAPETPLVAAASFERWDVVEALLNRGANPNVRDRVGWAPIDYAAKNAARADRSDIVTRLIEKGARVDDFIAEKRQGTQYERLRPLTYAVMEADTQVVAALLKAGANVNTQNAGGMTPLMLAVRNQKEPIVDVLLAARADLKPVDSYGRAALNYATFNATPSIVSKLIDAGADLNFQSPPGMHHGETALMHAIHAGKKANVEVMLQRSASTEIRDAKGLSALDHAKKTKRDDLIALLSK